MKICCLKYFTCTDLSDEQSAFDGLQKIIICLFISFLKLQVNEFLQSEIKQKLSSVQKITCITAIVNKKIILCSVYLGYCVPRLNQLFKLKSLQLVSIFSWNPQR